MSQPLLFTPLTVRDVTIRNRIVISPMCQYSANDGVAGDWHMVHLGRYATGGAGLVFTEAAAVERIGRITHGDLGIWSDTHRDALARIVGFLKTEGATPAIQLAHAGRKASMQRPWEGNGPLGAEEFARGETAWPIQAPSADPVMDGWLEPTAMSTGDIARVVQAFADSARRADEAGFEVVEIHSAHGYLCASYLSPVSNRRNDRYGGDRAATDVARVMRLPGFRNCKPGRARSLITWTWYGGRMVKPEDFRGLPRPEPKPASRTERHRRTPPGHHSQSERDWAAVGDALRSGEDPDTVVLRLKQQRQDKPNPDYYAHRTVRRKAEELKKKGLLKG